MPEKLLGHFHCVGVTHDFNKFLTNFIEIRAKKPTRKTSKKSH